MNKLKRTAPEGDLPPIYEGENIGHIDFWRRPAEERDEVFSELRRHAPLTRHRPVNLDPTAPVNPDPTSELGAPPPFWAIVRYDDIRYVSRHPELFRSGEGVTFGDAPKELIEATLSFLAMDSPRHTKLRGLVSAAFTPRQVARIEDGIRANARLIVQEAAAAGSGDFVDLVAKRLPLMTISDMIGVPEEDRERVLKAADLLVTALDSEVSQGRPPMEVGGQAIFTLHQFASALATEREQRPQDDLMTALVQAEVDGERLTRAEIAAFFVLLSVAGNDTTRHSTSQALYALTHNPDQRELLQEDLDGRLPLAVEEFIRWATPVTMFRRTTSQPVEMHGITIPAGEKVILFYNSGNRDETVFEDPWRFDITRDPNRHVGFGGGGPHFCLGASLARTQLRAIFKEIFTQMPGIEAGERVMYQGGPLIQGVKRLPFTF